MFVRKGKFDSKVLLDTGPVVSRAKSSPLEMSFMNGMDQRSMETCTNKLLPVLSKDISAEPDSSVNYAEDTSVFQSPHKFAKDHMEITSTELPTVESIDRVEDNNSQKLITTSIFDRKSMRKVETESNLDRNNDSNKTYLTSVRSVCGNVVAEPIETSIIQNISKLTKNFTLNVNSGVSNLGTIQNVVQSVPSGNASIWLPTIVGPSTIANPENHVYEETEIPTTTVSQIYVTGTGQHFPSHSVNSSLMSTSKQCHISNHKFPPKVQILGGIAIPKQNSLTGINQSGVTSKVKTIHANYINSSELPNSSVSSTSTKQIITNSVLNQIPNKMHSTNLPFGGARGQCGPVQVKCSSVINSANLQMKGIPTTVNRSIGKINNNNNTGKIVENSTHINEQSGHIYSRVVPTSKISLQPTSRVVKSSSIHYGQKSTMVDTHQTSTIIQGPRIPPPLPLIIQQQPHKAGFKTVPTSKVGMTKNLTYSPVNSMPGKTWSQASAPNINHVAHQKPNPSFAKNITGVVNVQKVNCKNSTQKMVVHQPSNQIIMSNTTPLNRINSQHYQSSGDVGNAQNIRFVSNYVGMENNNTSNPNIAAQIMQSFSQPKILMPSVQHLSPTSTSNKRLTVSNRQVNIEDIYVKKSFEQKRQVHGDPNTVLGSEDMLGTEQRPVISDDSLPYHYHSLQLVMLDHTYAQAISTNSVNGSNAVTSNSPPINNNNVPVSSPASPTKVVPHVENTTSPNIVLSKQSPTIPVSIVLTNSNVNSNIIQSVASYQYNPAPIEEDDAASIISSIEGDRDNERTTERHDSDTETAPEGEEEGKTRCVCEFTHDDGYMICCDKCGEWQHVDCMGIDRQNIPDDYMCDRCEPRLIDRKRARSIQIRKREEITCLGSSGSDSSSGTSINNHRNKQVPLGASSSHKKRPLTVTTYSNTISGVSRTVPTLPLFSPSFGITSPPSMSSVKKVSKRSRRIDNSRKVPKRKLPEKRKRKTSEISGYRSKFCSLSSSSQISQWSESYELAVTNHYSPELRAKVARYSNRGGNTSPNMAIIVTAHLCTTVPHAGSKILIATKDMKENAPIIELRGKYMLSNQHKPQPQMSGRVGSQRPGPFLFFYRLPKDSTQICIDTRTYGNEARYVRRSCKPNAELQHCFVKGTLHVYLVTTTAIQSNTEITLHHDSNGVFQPCACGNPKHCKQTGMSNSVIHRNNGAANDTMGVERRGRTRYASSSSINYSANLCPKYDDFLKSDSPEPEKHESIDQDHIDIMKREVIESIIFDKNIVDNDPPVCENELPLIDIKPSVESVIETVSAVIDEQEVEKKPLEFLKEDNIIKCDVQKEEIPIIEPLVALIEAENKLTLKLEDFNQPPKETECKSPIQSVPKSPVISSLAKSKENDKTVKKVGNSRRTSVNSMRTTRALSTSQFSTCESADEKSDTQSDSKVQSTKEKKKLTREERKMEAIMKAFERMEKAEQRKLENKDKQTKRRESDTQLSSSTEKECKYQQIDDQNDDSEQSSLKRRRRKKGRARTTSQNQSLRNRNRLNSIDSDMVTSGEESTSVLSPPPVSGNVNNDNYSESMALSSSENLTNFQSPTLPDTIALRESVHRLNVGLSSACLLVEAAVGPLESTFKFPKTKKDMMNEWLNKSPERNSLYDSHHVIDYMNSGNNNSGVYDDKHIKKLMKSSKSDMSGDIISTDSTLENNFTSESDNNATFNNMDSSGDISPAAIRSPQPYSQKIMKKLDNDVFNDSSYVLNERRGPRRPRKGLRGMFDEHYSPIKRSLRSNAGIEHVYGIDGSNGSVTPPHDESNVTMPPVDEIRDSETLTAPQPPQHSAKKRWLRQAISEESDSPTAESPPNEMVTPLKKRRLARESLSLEPPFTNCEDPPYIATPIKQPELHLQNIVNNNTETQVQISSNVEKLTTTMEKTEFCENLELIENCKEVAAKDVKLHSIIEERNETVENVKVEHVFENVAKELLCDNEVKISPKKEVDIVNSENDQTSILSDLKFNLSNLSKFQGNKAEDDACLEDRNINKNAHDMVSRDIKSEPVSNINSAETSGNSSPVLDDIDDIKKKIHSFHTENIQILKIRNKKQPKEKRKKVNLNFDLCVLDDQTVGVKLRSEGETNESPNNENISFASEGLSRMFTDTSPQKVIGTSPQKITESDSSPKKHDVPMSIEFSILDNPTIADESNAGFKCTPLFSGSFKDEANPVIQMPDINVIKNAIDMTTSLEIGFKSSSTSSSVDEYKNVQEILSHVNQMDSRNSVLLSGVLRDSNRSKVSEICPVTSTLTSTSPANRTFAGRPNDPRLNPPPVETPKPIRRKLSINEYRRRHSMVSTGSTGETESSLESMSNTCQNDSIAANQDNSCSSNSSFVSDKMNMFVDKNIDDSMNIESAASTQSIMDNMPKTIEDVNAIIGYLPIASEVEAVAEEAASPSQFVCSDMMTTTTTISTETHPNLTR